MSRESAARPSAPRRRRRRRGGPPVFLKWAGGKRQLLPELLARLPERFGHYHEPFVGSGALFFALHAAGRLADGATLADANPHLVQLYEAVRDEVEAVIALLAEETHSEARFYELRALDPAELTTTERAARFLYLNKTCFNGLYRENASGAFNVPFGHYVDPDICPADVLRAASAALQGATLRCEDFAAAAERAEPGDLVYFDPPYVPLNPTSSFTAYRKGGFGEEDHRRLAHTFRRLSERGVHVALSNSDATLVHRLYAGETIERVLARRSINSKGDRRGAIHEVIVTPRPSDDDPPSDDDRQRPLL